MCSVSFVRALAQRVSVSPPPLVCSQGKGRLLHGKRKCLSSAGCVNVGERLHCDGEELRLSLDCVSGSQVHDFARYAQECAYV